MTKRIWRAFRVEAAKALRMRFTYVGPVLVALTVAGASLAHPLARDGHGDYGFIAYATGLGLNLLGLLLLVTYCAGTVSTELGRGTARLLLVRPLLRSEYLAAKLLFGMAYAAALVLVAGVASWSLALGFGDLRGVSLGGELMHTGGEMILAYLAAAALSLFPLWAAAAYAVMISTLTRSSGAAIGSAVGVWLVVDVLKYPLGAAPYLFSTHMGAPWALFASRADGLPVHGYPDVIWCVGTSAVWTAVFAAVAALVLQRRNLQG